MARSTAGVELNRVFGILMRKLRLRQDMGELRLASLVTPVVDIALLIQDPKSRVLNLDLTPAIGAFVTGTGGTVPVNKRWRVILVLHGAAAGITSVMANLATDRDASNILIQLQAIVAAETVTYTQDLVLEAGDQIGGRSTGNAGDTSIAVRWLYYEEDSSVG